MEEPQAQDRTTDRYSVFRIPEALSNWRAVLLIVSSVLGFALLVLLGQQLPASLGWIFYLAGFVVYLAGLSGVGIALLDQARGKAFAPLPHYFTGGLFSLPRLLGCTLLALLVLLGVVLVAAIYLVLCKLPVFGPLLLAVGIPVLVVALAATLAGIYLALALAGPAIWDGQDIASAFRAALAILRQHCWAALAKLFGGLLLSMMIGCLFLSFVWGAGGILGALGVGIIGSSVGGTDGLMQLGAQLMYGEHNATLLAAMIGFGIVYFVSVALVSLMPCMVAVLTWLEFSAKIDLAGAREQAGADVEALRQKLQQTREKFSAPPSAAEPTRSSAPACPRCGEALQPGDRFCGNCGAPTDR